MIIPLITAEQVLGLGLTVAAVVVLGFLFGWPIVERVKFCKKEYGKDWRKHF